MAPNLLQQPADAALAAVVIAAAIGLVEVADLRRIYRIQRWEFWLSMVCFAGVAVFGAIPGIAIAIVIAVIEFLWDGWRPHSAVLGRVDQVQGLPRHHAAIPRRAAIPGLVLFRWDAPLFFANAELFRDRVLDAVAGSPTPVRWRRGRRRAGDQRRRDCRGHRCASSTTAARRAGIELCFAEMKDPVKDKLKRFGLFARFGARQLFATIGEAVNAYLAAIRSSGSTGRQASRRSPSAGGACEHAQHRRG